MPKLKDLLDSTNTAISIIRDLIITEAKENLSKVASMVVTMQVEALMIL